MKLIVAVVALVWLAVLGQPSAPAAHTTSTGLATLVVSGSTLSYRLTILPNELPAEAAQVLGSAADGDPASVERVALELRRRVTARADLTPCRPGRARIQGYRSEERRVGKECRL